MTSWHSFPSIFALGHRAVANLTAGSVHVEEKVDGSQFSFGVFDAHDADGQVSDGATVLRVRSKGAVMVVDAPEKMFTEAVETAKRLEPVLTVGWTYRGEYLKKPKHNALVYNRIPAQHVILFDVNTGHETYLDQHNKRVEAQRLGLEVVPLLFTGILKDINDVRQFLDRESVLGGQKIEGVVVKPAAYDQFGPDKKLLMGKFVSEAFKEVHAQSWKQDNPGPTDIVERIIASHMTAARWHKAVQHLGEAGQLEQSPRDIGKLMTAVPADIEKEEADAIKATLYMWAWPQIRRGVVRGLPEWYKEELLKKQFSE